MKFFYLSTQINYNGFYEIHHRECPNLPDIHNRIYLGPFVSSKQAQTRSEELNPEALICDCCRFQGGNTMVFSNFKSEDSKLRF